MMRRVAVADATRALRCPLVLVTTHMPRRRRRPTHPRDRRPVAPHPRRPKTCPHTQDTPEAKHTIKQQPSPCNTQGQMAGKAINAFP
eukprot:4676883-Prymnesium_polylepis.2